MRLTITIAGTEVVSVAVGLTVALGWELHEDSQAQASGGFEIYGGCLYPLGVPAIQQAERAVNRLIGAEELSPEEIYIALQDISDTVSDEINEIGAELYADDAAVRDS